MAGSVFADFEPTVHEFMTWWIQAGFLREAARSLWRDVAKVPYRQFVCLMLYGFAMENLIKALIVKKDPSLPLIEKGAIKWGVNGHDLLSLIEKAGIDPTEDERLILPALTEWAVWQGRYPTSMDAESYSNERTVLNPDAIEECFQRLSSILEGG